MQARELTPTGKRKKGSVAIHNNKGSVQLIFTFNKKRRYISPGLPYNTRNVGKAEELARQIEADIYFGNFDETLARYLPKKSGDVVQLPTQELPKIWAKFVTFKSKQCSPNTMYHTYNSWTTKINQLPSHNLTDAPLIRDHIISTMSVDGAKRFLTRLSACCDHALKSKLIDSNPFHGMAGEIKQPKSQGDGDEYDIFIFTSEELKAIKEALYNDTFKPLKSNTKHSFYAPWVEFLMQTGCRPSESCGLQWGDIDPGYRSIKFERAVIDSKAGKQFRQGLKSQERRSFPVNRGLRVLLEKLKDQALAKGKAASSDLIFPGAKGGYLHTKSFVARVWKPVLKGLGIQYRRPYQLRHTFISHSINIYHVDVDQVSKWVGNTREVCVKHYLRTVEHVLPPEL